MFYQNKKKYGNYALLFESQAKNKHEKGWNLARFGYSLKKPILNQIQSLNIIFSMTVKSCSRTVLDTNTDGWVMSIIDASFEYQFQYSNRAYYHDWELGDDICRGVCRTLSNV